MEQRVVFYNGSSFDGDDGLPGPSDDDAIATAKEPLFDAQTATIANYHSFQQGINGLIIDVEGAASVLDETDFLFKVGNDDFPANWATAPEPLSVSVSEKAGQNDSDRVTIVWADGDITNTWLQVTLLANNRTGLATDDVFYFGNIIGDTGNSTTDAIVDTLDLGGVRENFSGFVAVPVTSLYDHNHDGRVDTLDLGVIRENFTGFIPVNLIRPNGSSSSFGSGRKDSEMPKTKLRPALSKTLLKSGR